MSPLVLLAQDGPGVVSGDMPEGLMIVLIMAAVMAVPITGIITGMKYKTKERELQHAERMKALERGVPFDEVDEERRFRNGVMWLAVAIGAVVPSVAAMAAAIAVVNMRQPIDNLAVFLIWTGAALVGASGVASGAWLAQGAITRLSPRRGSAITSPYAKTYESPEAAAIR